MSSRKGRFISWDWHQQKYVWVSKEELRAKVANKGQVLQPSPSLKNCNQKNNKSGFKVPSKRPLEVYKKNQKKQASQAKKPRVSKSKPAEARPSHKQPEGRPSHKQPEGRPSHKQPEARPSRRQPAKKVVQRRKLRKPVSEKMADKGHGRDETDVANPPHELLQGHDTFMSVMTNRLIHQGAALTFWRQSPNALVSYLVRTSDDAVTVDVLPILTESFSGMKANTSQLSMGACVDMIPTLRKLLDSKFEDYVKASLDFIRTMVRFYSKDLQTMKNAPVSNLQKSQSLYGIYMGIVSMTDKLDKLAKRKDSVGQKAVIVAELVHKF